MGETWGIRDGEVRVSDSGFYLNGPGVSELLDVTLLSSWVLIKDLVT